MGDTMHAWAIPLGDVIYDRAIGEHTWVTGDGKSGAEGYCDGCRFGTASLTSADTPPDSYYCDHARWKNGVYTPPSNARELGKVQGDTGKASCIGGREVGKFMGIPAQAGIVYAINGVCHQLANRILYGTGLTTKDAKGAVAMTLLFGVYGELVPVGILALFGLPLYLAGLAVQVWDVIDWSVIRSSCNAGMAMSSEVDPETREYLQALAELHAKPVGSRAREEWTADDIFEIQQVMHKRTIQEIELSVQYYGRGIDSAKLRELIAFWTKVHAPARATLDRLLGKGAKFTPASLPAKSMSESEARCVAYAFNFYAGLIVRQVANILGPADFGRFHGHAPEEALVLIEPDILIGSAT